MQELLFTLMFEFQHFRQSFDAYTILTDRDHELELEHNRWPALSSANFDPNPWASFNEWTCFPTRSAFITYTNIDYRGPRKVPSIRIQKQNIVAYFELGPDIPWKADKIIRKWYDLTEGEEHMCIYAAQLPRHKHTGNYELWYIDQIKTLSGYWEQGDVEDEDYE